MGTFFDGKRLGGVAVGTVVSFLFVTLVTYGATTISTSINTGGSLTVSGGSTLSSTLSVTGNATFDTTSLFVDASNHRVGILTITPSTALEVYGTASSTGLVVGGQSTITGLIKGTCAITPQSVTATSTFLTCKSATGVRTTDLVFVQSTSTLATAAGASSEAGVFISGARSTTSGQIELNVLKIPLSEGGTASGTISYWVIR